MLTRASSQPCHLSDAQPRASDSGSGSGKWHPQASLPGLLDRDPAGGAGTVFPAAATATLRSWPPPSLPLPGTLGHWPLVGENRPPCPPRCQVTAQTAGGRAGSLGKSALLGYRRGRKRAPQTWLREQASTTHRAASPSPALPDIGLVTQSHNHQTHAHPATPSQHPALR